MTADLTLQTVALVWAGAFLGAMTVGAAGFALGLTASAIWLHVLDPLHNTILIVGCGFALHVTLTWRMRASIDMPRLWPFLVGGLIGVPLGVFLLTHVDLAKIKIALGVFILVYGVYAFIAPKLPHIAGGGRTADGTVGLAAGVLGGLAGYNGVLPAIWTQLRGWPKETARAVYQPFILATHVAILACLGIVALDWLGVILWLLALPPLFAGAWVGWKIYGRLSESRFRQVLAALLVVSGATLIWS
jgi:uncharacterized membrane protein YfcA